MKRTLIILTSIFLLSCSQTQHVQSDNFPTTFDEAEAYADSLFNVQSVEEIKGL